MDQEDFHWKQISKQHWYQDGDMNNKFFHACTNQRRRKNFIHRITIKANVTLENEIATAIAFQDYCTCLFSSSLPSNDTIIQSTCDIETRVAKEMNACLLGVTWRKKCMWPWRKWTSKSPRLDGFGTSFYQKHWDLVSEDFCTAMLNILHSMGMNSSFNSTYIAFILKKCNPQFVTDFSPISLYNVIHKLVSKVIINILWTRLFRVLKVPSYLEEPSPIIFSMLMTSYIPWNITWKEGWVRWWPSN